MGRIEKTVFISYRRTNMPWALAIYQDLTLYGFDVFFDYQSIHSGDFERIILANIRARAHFLVLLTPSALERCDLPGDWLRREIENAIDEKRNIVPIFLEGFDFSTPSIASRLTGKLELLKRYNGLNVPTDYFFEAMERLRTRFLNISLDTVLHPVSKDVVEVVQSQQAAAGQAKQVEKLELSTQEWFEKSRIVLGDTSFRNLINDKIQPYIQLGKKKEASESISRLIELYEKQAEDEEIQYVNSRDNWISQAEHDRSYGKSSDSMTEYYDNEVLADYRGHQQVSSELTNKVVILRSLLSKVQASE